MTTTRKDQGNTPETVLHVAFELGLAQWKLAFTIGLGQSPRLKTVCGRDRDAVLREIAAAKRRFGLPDDALVVSCYEAGRDGFWLHRWLLSVGVQNHIVDSSSIEVNRRRRRAKSDQLDAAALGKRLGRSGTIWANTSGSCGCRTMCTRIVVICTASSSISRTIGPLSNQMKGCSSSLRNRARCQRRLPRAVVGGPALGRQGGARGAECSAGADVRTLAADASADQLARDGDEAADQGRSDAGCGIGASPASAVRHRRRRRLDVG